MNMHLRTTLAASRPARTGRMISRAPFMVAAGAVLISGCGHLTLTYEAGAQKIFSQDQLCPAERVVARLRPDIPPHTLAATIERRPPVGIASDPERVKMWQAQQATRAQSLDADAKTVEASGCGTTVVYLCDHPDLLDFNSQDGRIVGDNMMQICNEGLRSPGESNCTVPSAVRCVGRSHEVARVGDIGDTTARINAPDVVRLPPHSEVPAPPATMKGLRVLVVSELNGDAAYKAAAASKAACDRGVASLVEAVGWTRVSDEAQRHDLVMRGECTSLAGNQASNGALFLLKPLHLRGPRFETPDGQLVDEIAPSGSTFACPVADVDQCLAAAGEYATAYFVNSVAHSAKLAAYVTHARAAR